MSEFSDDQVHPATPARREQARRDGEFAKSHELAAAIQMLGAIGIAFLLFGQLGNWMQQMTTATWGQTRLQISLTSTEIGHQLSGLIFSSLSVIAPIGLMLIGVGILSHWCQTGPVFVTNKLAPDPNRIAPANWFRRLFSLSTLAFPLVGIPKSILAIVVMCSSCWLNRQSFFILANYPANEMVQRLFELVLTVSAHVAFALLLASIVDYGLKYLSFQKRLQMTDQQLRDELRMQNGNPQINAHRRRK